MGGRVTAYLATTWQLDGRKLQLNKVMDLLMVMLIRIQNENCLMSTDRESFGRREGHAIARWRGVILSNHSQRTTYTYPTIRTH